MRRFVHNFDWHKTMVYMFDKVDEFITDQKDLLLMDLNIKYYLALKNMMPFSKGLYIL